MSKEAKSQQDEIPDTETGLNLYFNYCKRQITANKNHINRLKLRMAWCIEKANKLGLKIKDSNAQTDNLEDSGAANG